MAQFDVFRNRGRHPDLVPFFVSLQSNRHRHSAGRFMGPLVPVSLVDATALWLAPRFTIDGTAVALDVFNLVTVPKSRLGTPIATLADEDSRARIVRALDEFLSQA